MFGKLPLESLGWLLVDEAGQATPQAAVGALLRTKRAVIVGDPIQIEPVVELPDKLTIAICRHFGVDPDIYNAPSASAQTLADAASAFTGKFPTDLGYRVVGAPLLAHRRCSDPMFKISNKLAYSGFMVYAKSSKSSRIRDALGPSAWFDVHGSAADGHWCKEEGDEALRLLSRLAQEDMCHDQEDTCPDIYIIKPFTSVASNMRGLARNSEALSKLITDKGRRKQWIKDRIGTVHTAQGREAEAVIFVLGAPERSQGGAREWAGKSPNLLNVAVTRAKEAIYVIGNRELWLGHGSFRELDILELGKRL
jgi:hypothetical protein